MFAASSSKKHAEALQMSFNPTTDAIRVEGLGKSYRTYQKPVDRLKQSIFSKRRYYDEFHALKEINLTVSKGESLGIIGRNGSGKSTMLQLICGTLTPTAGQVQTHGKIAALLELGSGFNPDFTGIENVYLNASIFGLSKHETDNQLESILAFADIGNFVHQPLKTYSSGMMVRLAFAVITHVHADVLVIDEALAVGDIFFTQKCSRYMRGFRERGTLLFVSHDMDSVKSLCDRAVLLEHGELKMIGPTKDVADHYFAEAFGNDSTDGDPEQVITNDTEATPTPDPAATAMPEIRPRARLNPWFDFRQQRYGDQAFGARMEVSSFEEAIRHSDRFGDNTKVEFLHVGLIDPVSGAAATAFHGGYPYVLTIVCRCHQTMAQPDIGFCLNDRLGQVLFGDNTNTLNNSQPWTAGETYQVQFEFDMPVLRTGEYTITVAAQVHQQLPPVILNWIHDALLIYTQHSSTAVGLSGVPMRRILITPVLDLEPQQTSDHAAISTETPVDRVPLTAIAVRQQRDENFRVAMTCSCKDSDVIDKVPHAGEIQHDPTSGETIQIMHNGLRVVAGGYYGDWMSSIIQSLRGHHEPQEEVLFNAVLKRLGNQPATMIELGSFWSYYSLWFLKENPSQRRALCVEADPAHLEIGRRNARLNNLSPNFMHGFAGETASTQPVAFPTEKSGTLDLECYCVDQLMALHQMDHLDILHLDTQGAELSVLKGASEAIRQRKIRFLVVSTHSYEICGDPLIHQRCVAWLQEQGAHIICEHDVHESFSGDGLIVASLSDQDRDWSQTISRNRYATSLFPNPAYYVPMRPQESPVI